MINIDRVGNNFKLGVGRRKIGDAELGSRKNFSEQPVIGHRKAMRICELDSS